MSSRENQYLHEMGISLWELCHPERLTGYQAPQLELPLDCKLLLVSPVCPENQTALLFERVLKSIHLPLERARHIEPERLFQLGEHQLEWVWFAGCQASTEVQAKILTSPLLADIDGNNEQRRALWQQICSYA
ncbi:DNA polymerase III subunit psi [Vibrio sp. CAU 1672]|uniref:DNA polymerase III subunit psi n=1 Tax=Vibrio sp. CAU 1672 TaxID=3032594 RepID=UPI0023DC4BC6|nr:DNA polymerase III subunit psi [Vibrio sp. CAU 1672]MDF2154454.1 DNA polymerase III subunit psi [Vibrio sp. CAU 1672]